MRRNKLPENRLDIVVPVFGHTVDLIEHPAFMEEVRETRLYPITRETPPVARYATEMIAYYFRREFGYDFPPYTAHEREDARDHIFLLIREDMYEKQAIGAIVFRWREYRDAPDQLVLAWVWIHPFFRSKGILTAYWETFRNLYGDFHVEAPLSKAMASFLQKMKPHAA